jgi:4-carboxymuconolactone decarboxylase
VQGAFKNGATIMEIHEVLLHGAVYVGAPAAIEAFRNAQEVFNELGLRLPDEA